jgi:hypothetical protein
MECPVCKKQIEAYTGRRPKKFCGDVCKVKYFNAKKRVAENKQEVKEDIIPSQPPATKPLSRVEQIMLDLEAQEKLKNKPK